MKSICSLTPNFGWDPCFQNWMEGSKSTKFDQNFLQFDAKIDLLINFN
jgi:hypothetical protein